jgi:hypothetical protein
MNHKAIFAALCLGAASLGGCAELQQVENFLTSPQTQQSVQTIATVSTLFVCEVANAAALAGQIEAAVNAGQAVEDTNGKVWTVSAMVCSALGGRISGSAPRASIVAGAGTRASQ